MSAAPTREDVAWAQTLTRARSLKPASHHSAIVALPWHGTPEPSLRDLLDGRSDVALLVDALHEALLPGGHLALWVTPSHLGAAGAMLRLSGFEVRDTITVARGHDLTYWVMARKEPDGSVIDSTLQHSTGGINIDACRIPTAGQGQGRWPANMLLNAQAAADIDRQAPSAGAGGPASGPTFDGESKSNSMAGKFKGMNGRAPAFHGDTGGASRFFPSAGQSIGAEWVAQLITVAHGTKFEAISNDLAAPLLAQKATSNHGSISGRQKRDSNVRDG